MMAFYFKVVLAGSDQSASFQEVSGIASEMEAKLDDEGGEGPFSRKLPTGVTHSNLVLKRGTAGSDSPLVVDAFSSTRNEVAIESIELTYSHSSRVK